MTSSASDKKKTVIKAEANGTCIDSCEMQVVDGAFRVCCRCGSVDQQPLFSTEAFQASETLFEVNTTSATRNQLNEEVYGPSTYREAINFSSSGGSSGCSEHKSTPPSSSSSSNKRNAHVLPLGEVVRVDPSDPTGKKLIFMDEFELRKERDNKERELGIGPYAPTRPRFIVAPPSHPVTSAVATATATRKRKKSAEPRTKATQPNKHLKRLKRRKTSKSSSSSSSSDAYILLPPLVPAPVPGDAIMTVAVKQEPHDDEEEEVDDIFAADSKMEVEVEAKATAETKTQPSLPPPAVVGYLPSANDAYRSTAHVTVKPRAVVLHDVGITDVNWLCDAIGASSAVMERFKLFWTAYLTTQGRKQQEAITKQNEENSLARRQFRVPKKIRIPRICYNQKLVACAVAILAGEQCGEELRVRDVAARMSHENISESQLVRAIAKARIILGIPQDKWREVKVSACTLAVKVLQRDLLVPEIEDAIHILRARWRKEWRFDKRFIAAALVYTICKRHRDTAINLSEINAKTGLRQATITDYNQFICKVMSDHYRQVSTAAAAAASADE